MRSDKCPVAQDDVEITIAETNKYYERVWKWNQTVPLNEAYSWFCKYLIHVTDSALLTAQNAADGESPMLAIEVEPYGFDEQVWLITQPRGQFRDYKY